jgi:hypothetical protein
MSTDLSSVDAALNTKMAECTLTKESSLESTTSTQSTVCDSPRNRSRTSGNRREMSDDEDDEDSYPLDPSMTLYKLQEMNFTVPKIVAEAGEAEVVKFLTQEKRIRVTEYQQYQLRYTHRGKQCYIPFAMFLNLDPEDITHYMDEVTRPNYVDDDDYHNNDDDEYRCFNSSSCYEPDDHYQ